MSIQLPHPAPLQYVSALNDVVVSKYAAQGWKLNSDKDILHEEDGPD